MKKTTSVLLGAAGAASIFVLHFIAIGMTKEWQKDPIIAYPSSLIKRMGLGAVVAPQGLLDIAADMTASRIKGPAIQMAVHENNPDGFIGAVFLSDRLPGGGGPLREAVHAEQVSHGGVPNEQIGALTAFGHLIKGSGTIYGSYSIAKIEETVDASSSMVGVEIDTEAKRDMMGKVGQQIIDVGSGHGTANDVALMIGENVGAAGFGVGIKFGVLETSEPSFGIKPDGMLMYAEPTSRPLKALIDWSRLSGKLRDGAILLPASENASIKFGGAAAEGGSIVSGTKLNGMQLLFGNRQTTLSRRGAAGVTVSDAGIVTAAAYKATLTTPASSSAPCEAGRFSDDTKFHYVCVADNHWKRIALEEF